MNRSFLLACTCLLTATLAQAQTAPPRPPAPPAANDIPLALAVEAAQAAIAACKANGYSVTATVSDKDYGTRVSLRGDGAGLNTTDVGRKKNYTVLKRGMSSLENAKAVGPQPRPPGGGAMMDPSGDTDIFLAGGGIQIKKNGEVVGALSVSGAPGGDKDEVCANAGLAAISDRLK